MLTNDKLISGSPGENFNQQLGLETHAIACKSFAFSVKRTEASYLFRIVPNSKCLQLTRDENNLRSM